MFGLKSRKEIDSKAFKVGTKEVLGDAKDTKFFTNFFTSNKVTFVIGLVGQILSGITEFIFIFRACGGELPFIQRSNFLAILSGLFAVYLFEYLGVRIYLIRIVRQLIEWDFNTPQKVTLFVLNTIFCLSILGANFGTSIVGQSTTFAGVKNIDNSDTIVKIEELLLSEIDTIKLKCQVLNDTLKAQSIRDKNDIDVSFALVIKDLNRSKWSTKDKVKQDNINDEIRETNALLLSSKKAIADTLSSQVFANNKLMNESIKTAKSKAKVKKDAIGKSENSQLDILAMIERYSLILLIAFMVLAILAIVYREVYINGSKQDVELRQVKERPVLVVALLYGLYMKFYHLCYKLVVKIVGSKAFDYSKIMQSKDDFYSVDVSPIRIGKGKELTPVMASNIGFGSNRTDPTIDPKNARNTIETQRNIILSKYNLQTVATWFKRSDLVQSSQSKDESTQKRNRIKYLNAKKELISIGARFSESKTNVSITI